MNTLWFTARGTGLTALLVLSLTTALGAASSVKSRAVAGRIIAQSVHRTSALLGLALIVVHVSTIILDGKAHIGVSGALIPFTAHYRPNAVAAGTAALYIFVFAATLGLARGRLANSPTWSLSWRALHATAYLGWGLAVLHELLAGTDAHQPWVRMLTIGCVALVAIALLYRLFGMSPAQTPSAGPAPRTPARSR
jgi:predicted ferric reductase